MPAPMLGSVDVAVDRVVEDPLGLWVTYNITGGTATPNVDFVSSAFRRTSTDPLSEKYGTIIPANEQTGKIYFYVKPDAIVEPAESATITLTSNSFLGVVGGQDYKVGTSNVATVNITDNDAYRQGVQVTDLAGRPITADSPLYISPTTGQADIKVRLTSQPNYPTVNPQQVVISLGGYPSVSYNYANGLYSSQNLVFTPANWDVPQTVTLVRPNAPTGTFTISGYSFPGTSYLPTTISFPYTQTPPNRVDTTEGSELDASAVPPTVSLLTVRGGREGSDQPALVQVNLNNAAPKGGLDISYTIVAPTTGSATSNVDFRLPSGVVRVAEGEKLATIPIDILDDFLIEGNESLIVRLVAQPKYVVGTPSDAAVVISDDDRATISVSNPSFVDVNSTKSIVRRALPIKSPARSTRMARASDNLWDRSGRPPFRRSSIGVESRPTSMDVSTATRSISVFPKWPIRRPRSLFNSLLRAPMANRSSRHSPVARMVIRRSILPIYSKRLPRRRLGSRWIDRYTETADDCGERSFGMVAQWFGGGPISSSAQGDV